MAFAADSHEVLDTHNLYILATAACMELEKQQRCLPISFKTKKKRTALVAAANAAVTTPAKPPLKKLKVEFAELIYSSVSTDLKSLTLIKEKEKKIARDYNPIPKPPALREATASLKQKIAGTEPIMVAEKPLIDSDPKRNLVRLQIPESPMNIGTADLKALTLIKKEKKEKKIVHEYNPIAKPGPPPLIEAPASLKQTIAEMDGTDPILVVEKPLTDSDLKRNLVRFQIPESPMNIGTADLKALTLIKKPKEKKKIVRDYNPTAKPGPPPLIEAPASLKQTIAEMDGTDPILVAEKPLTDSDLKRNLGRLQIPESQMNKFLSDEESGYLNIKVGSKLNGIGASLHQYSGKGEYLGFSGVKVKRWPMKKSNGSAPAIMCVLTTGWNDVVSRNKLNAGDLVQVWSFRVLNELHLALLLL